jgi:3',5'-cyclic AMP phosphodiesterase CpdA
MSWPVSIAAVTRLTVVSDSHLSERAPEAAENWSAILRYVQLTRPDLVIHAGDLSLDGAHDGADLHYARSKLDQLTVPWLVVPGNHDVGDNPASSRADPEAIDADRRERWLEVVGPDRFAADCDGWRIIAINAQLFGSRLPADDDQWDWLESEMRQVSGANRVALVLHKPVAATDAEISAAPVYRFIPATARRRLAELRRARPINLVLNGPFISAAASNTAESCTSGRPRRVRSCLRRPSPASA